MNDEPLDFYDYIDETPDDGFCHCNKPKVMTIDSSKIEYADGHVNEFYAEVCIKCNNETR